MNVHDTFRGCPRRPGFTFNVKEIFQCFSVSTVDFEYIFAVTKDTITDSQSSIQTLDKCTI